VPWLIILLSGFVDDPHRKKLKVKTFLERIQQYIRPVKKNNTICGMDGLLHFKVHPVRFFGGISTMEDLKGNHS
jgi:hypothetical protein